MSFFAFPHYKSFENFNSLINEYQLNNTTFLLAKCKHAIPDEAGRFDIIMSRVCGAKTVGGDRAQSFGHSRKKEIKSHKYNSVLPSGQPH